MNCIILVYTRMQSVQYRQTTGAAVLVTLFSILSESDMEEEVPAVRPGESLNDYFGHSKDYWLEQADTLVSKDSQQLTGKQLKKAAFQMAEEFFKQQGES